MLLTFAEEKPMKSFKSFIAEEQSPKEGGNGKKISVGKSTVKINPNSEELKEVAPPGDKYERLVKHIKKSYSKGGLTDKEKSIAYATAWKQKNQDTQESAVPGKPAERLGAVTAIPADEREAAKQRTLAKAAALRKKREEQKEEFEINEAEGSYGQTPKATAAYGALANRRRNTPASEYPKRGAKKVAVKSAERHMSRSENPDAGNRGKQSTKPHWTSDSRKGMTPKDRNWRRGADEYGHSGYDGEGGGGSLPKGKKLTRQKKTGVSEATRYEKETGKDYKTGKEVTKGGTLSGNDTNAKVMRHMHKVMGAGRMGSNGPIQPRGQKKVPGKKPPEAGKYGSGVKSPAQKLAAKRAAIQQGRDNMSSRFD